MRFAFCTALLAAMLVSAPALAQADQKPADAVEVPAGILKFQSDPRAALIEVLPPESMQQSPAASELIDRMMRKHALLLQHPTTVQQVIAAPGAVKADLAKDPSKLRQAIRVRVIPQTNIIEVMVDPDFAGDDAGKIAETIVNQHLENERQTGQSAQLERSVMLNSLKQRYQFRKDELARDLREKTVRLSIDGLGAPGRLSAKEMELQNLLQEQFRWARELDDAKAQLQRLKDDKKEDSSVTTAQRAVETAQTRLRESQERVDAAKKDLGDLTNAMNQYLTLKDDETTTRELLKQVNDQLEKISNSNAPPEIRWLCRPSKA